MGNHPVLCTVNHCSLTLAGWGAVCVHGLVQGRSWMANGKRKHTFTFATFAVCMHNLMTDPGFDVYRMDFDCAYTSNCHILHTSLTLSSYIMYIFGIAYPFFTAAQLHIRAYNVLCIVCVCIHWKSVQMQAYKVKLGQSTTYGKETGVCTAMSYNTTHTIAIYSAARHISI